MRKYLVCFFFLSFFAIRLTLCADQEIQKQIEILLTAPDDSVRQYTAANNLYQFYINIETTTEVMNATSAHQAKINKLPPVTQGILYNGSDELLTLAGNYGTPVGPTTAQFVTAIKAFLPLTKNNGMLAAKVATALSSLISPKTPINIQEWAAAKISELKANVDVVTQQNIASTIDAAVQSYGKPLPESVKALLDNPKIGK